MVSQVGLFGREPPAFDARFSSVRRYDLDDESWIEHCSGFLRGHEALFEHLAATTTWRRETMPMYERVVDVPRLLAALPDDGPGHPVVEQLREALSRRYGIDLRSVTMALYRDGDDSVAWHGDRVARELPQAHVVTLSLGSPRKFLMRRKEGGGGTLTFTLGWGDLMVMGGACQRTWQHCVPKAKRADPRLVVMFRPTWDGRA